MQLVIISGRSGSGKSAALHALEDLGYYAIDNLPAGLLIPWLSRHASSPISVVSQSVLMPAISRVIWITSPPSCRN